MLFCEYFACCIGIFEIYLKNIYNNKDASYARTKTCLIIHNPKT